MYQLCTVDVWDTLLRRRCHPEAIKLAVAQHVLMRCHQDLLPEMQDQWTLYRSRLDAELAIAQYSRQAGKDDEYELKDVFSYWIKAACPDMAADCVESLVVELRDHELQVEIQNTCPDQGILSFLKEHPAERVLYLSDFYMSSDLLDVLLAHHGFDSLLSGGIVSCDIGLNKRSGNLFRYVQEHEGVPANAHIHIGDNQHSDVEMPMRLGIKGVLYKPQEAHSERTATNSLFASRTALFSHVLEKLNYKLEVQTSKDNETARGMFLLGAQSAPLFIGFALFIAEQARLDRLDRLYFLTREGLFFLRVFQALFPENRHSGLTLPTPEILAVSRIATFLASIRSVNIEELNRIWRLNSQQKVSTLLNILDFEPQEATPFLGRYELQLDTVLHSPHEDQRLNALLSDTAFNDAVMKKVARRQELLADYLVQKGVTGNRIGIVDIGWRGTIQDNLAFIHSDAHWNGYYIALRKFLNPQPDNTEKHAYVLDERWDAEKHLFESFEPLELLCNCAMGSIISYARDSEGWITPLEDTAQEEASLIEDYVNHFQDGVAFATTHWAPFLSSHVVSAQEMRPLALRVWQRINDTPPSELIEAYYASPQHDLFGVGGLFDRGAVPSLGTIFLGVVSRSKRREVIHYIRRTQWSAALEGLQIGLIHKAVLSVVFRAAKLYKRFILMR